jgi:hypothetical protein
MPIPKPEPGLVIGYAYLWDREHDAGADEGRKDRPCAIIVTTLDTDGDTVVYIAPIIHTSPRSSEDAVEIPPKVKRRLKLDGDRSWVVTTEINRFIWPGYDLRPIRRDRPEDFVYGFLPIDLLEAIKTQIINHRRKRSLQIIART